MQGTLDGPTRLFKFLSVAVILTWTFEGYKDVPCKHDPPESTYGEENRVMVAPAVGCMERYTKEMMRKFENEEQAMYFMENCLDEPDFIFSGHCSEWKMFIEKDIKKSR